MALLHYLWSRTASNNATADSNVNWQEGQAPSSVNDSARAMMASASGFRDDIAGAIVTGGTSTAYTVGSYQVFNTLANMSGQMIAFTPHATNGNTVTLNVDSLGAKPLRPSPAVELQAGTLILGTPYMATYNNADAVWYLHGFYGNPYNVPIAGGMDYWAATAPNSSFVFPVGQAISRSTYAALFSLIGTTYGVGDGSTTFNVPDKTGRASVMKEASATRLTSTYFGGNSTVLGAVGGLESNNVILTHSHTGNTGNDTPDHTHLQTGLTIPNLVFNYSGGGGQGAAATGPFQTGGASTRHTHPFTTNNAGSASAHPTVQPSIVCNYIMRII